MLSVIQSTNEREWHWTLIDLGRIVKGIGIDIGIESDLDPAQTVVFPLALDHQLLDQSKTFQARPEEVHAVGQPRLSCNSIAALIFSTSGAGRETSVRPLRAGPEVMSWTFAEHRPPVAWPAKGNDTCHARSF
jgi:hypothetical protein